MNFSKIFQNSYVLPHAAAFVLPFLTDEKKNISQCFPCIRVVQLCNKNVGHTQAPPKEKKSPSKNN